MNRRSFFKALATLAVIPNAMLTGLAKANAARKPLIFGRVLNVPASPTNDGSLTYRVNDGRAGSIEAVRDGGMEIIIDGDEPTIHALLKARIPLGHARTCRAEGAFRLGAAPAFPVTVDATGEAMRPRVTRTDELAGAVRDGSYSREWRDALDAQGYLVHTWIT